MMKKEYEDLSYLKRVFDATEIIRKPVHRIISGYHQLPYIMIGRSLSNGSKTMKIDGNIHVSPRMIFRPGNEGQTYGDVFGGESIEPAIVARLFGFLYLREQTTAFASKDLSIEEVSSSVPEVTERVVDELARKECLDTGVIQSPDIGIYPVSIDRYIREMLDRELSAGTVR